MSEHRGTVTIEIFDLTDEEWAMTVPDFIKWVTYEVANVPEEFRDSVMINATEHDAGDYETKIVIRATYERPETDDWRRKCEEEKLAGDLRRYAELKARFG